MPTEIIYLDSVTGATCAIITLVMGTLRICVWKTSFSFEQEITDLAHSSRLGFLWICITVSFCSSKLAEKDLRKFP